MKINKISTPTFIEALDQFRIDPTKSKNFLNDKRLSLSEKQILICWQLLRDNKAQEAQNILEKISTSDNLVKAQIHLIKGCVLNNLSDYNEAKNQLNNSIELLKDYELPRHQFWAHYNYFIIELNLSNLDGMKDHIHFLEKYSSNDNQDIRAKLFCEFCYYTHFGDFKLAQKTKIKLDGYLDKTSESQKVAYLINVFHYYIVQNDFKNAHKTIDNLKQFRKFLITSNFKFMSVLLSFLEENKPIYLYEQDFIGSPQLYWQVKTLKALEALDKTQAEKSWCELQKINSAHYLKDFHYKGFKCLFSLCLNKLNTKSSGFEFHYNDKISKEQNLIQLLTQSKQALKKEDIYFLVWGEKLNDKNDLNKLKLMVAKLRKQYGLKIQSVKGCYLLTHTEKKSA